MNNKIFIEGLEPLIHEESKVLILGTMPGELSLELKQYYANPRNQFWQIMEKQIKGISTAQYKEKAKLLNEEGIALWDLLGKCEREGSLDSQIKRKTKVCNDFNSLFKKYTNIRAVLFNGLEACKLFHENVMQSVPMKTKKHLAFVPLPSSSGANSRKVSEKACSWGIITYYLIE